jgi:sarcosine oxidase subunit alpha
VGACAGRLELGAVLNDAFRVGGEMARAVGAAGALGSAPRGHGDPAPRLEPFWRSPCRAADEKRQFVDLQNDVTVADLRLALAEGFVDIEHIKRYTTLGIGTEQGRTGGLLGAAIVAELKGESLPEVGLSRPRPPYQPVTLGSLAGLNQGSALRVTRRTPLHEMNLSRGAVFEPAEYWLRTRYYRGNGADAFSAGIVEAERVRRIGGILDGSTLGKIEVAGADAAAFLDRLYLTRASTMKVGRAKYMVNLREDGMVLDDGLVLRIAPDRFLATTGSGHAEHMLAHFEHYRDLEWSGSAVALSNVTEAWAVIVVAGPASRTTLGEVLGPQWRQRLAQLTHMDFVTDAWNGAELRVVRASFSGELAFELHCRHPIAVALWDALAAAGLEPYGLEALDILRVEKGYLVSSEMNGQTTPLDLGMEALVRTGNPCVGRPMLERPAFAEPNRPCLVGLRACDGRSVIQGGAQITLSTTDTRSLGHVTSSVYSPTLGQWLALALVSRAHAAQGTQLVARDPLRAADCAVTVTAPVHVDPAGERMKA